MSDPSENRIARSSRSSSESSSAAPERSERWRTVVVLASVAVLLLSEAASFRRWELKTRIRLLIRTAGLPFDTAESRGSMFEFDPGYARFLEEVRRVVPPHASVAISLPSTTVQYLYTAHFALAPRPVVEARFGAQADYLAVYDPSAAGRTGVRRNVRSSGRRGETAACAVRVNS